MEHLQDLKQTARSAFYWNSFDPEKSGNRTLREHEEQLQSDLENIPETEKERYIENYRKYFIKWLNALSNCASSAVTGGANFNVSRAEKANRREHDVYGEFIEWRERALKAIAKKVENEKPVEQKTEELWEKVKKDIDNHYLPTNLYNRMETVARNGNVEVIERAIAYVRELNSQRSRPIFTERHKFFRLDEVAKQAIKEKEELNNKENKKQLFNGGEIVFNYQEDRLQLLFDEKPSALIIQQLKSNGFRWSPRFSAWQRQLTNNAIFVTKHILKENNLNCQ